MLKGLGGRNLKWFWNSLNRNQLVVCRNFFISRFFYKVYNCYKSSLLTLLRLVCLLSCLISSWSLLAQFNVMKSSFSCSIKIMSESLFFNRALKGENLVLTAIAESGSFVVIVAVASYFFINLPKDVVSSLENKKWANFV